MFATVTPIKVRRLLGHETVIDSGLADGDVVVTDGHLLLNDGTRVSVRERKAGASALDVQSALTVAARKLPIEMVVPPSFRKVNPADQPVIQFSLVSSTLPMSKVDDYAEITLAQQISQISGVAQVLVFGPQKFAVRVQVDPVAAASHGISMEDVRTVLAKTNSNTPVGTIAGIEAKQNTTLDASAAMRTAAEYRNVIAAYRNGVPIRLSEIANVVDDVENQLSANYVRQRKIGRAGDLQAVGRQHGQDRRRNL